jgi:hypothetical protein
MARNIRVRPDGVHGHLHALEGSGYWRIEAIHPSQEGRMPRKSGDGVPALQNEDVTGMTEEKEDAVIRESGRAPRSRAAEEFYEEEAEQAADTKRGDDQRK